MFRTDDIAEEAAKLEYSEDGTGYKLVRRSSKTGEEDLDETDKVKAMLEGFKEMIDAVERELAYARENVSSANEFASAGNRAVVSCLERIKFVACGGL